VITRGINHELSAELILFLWSRVDALKLKSSGNMDYLQVFELKDITEHENQVNQLIIHKTEQPEYEKIYAIKDEKPISDKIYIIDISDYSIMLFEYEY